MADKQCTIGFREAWARVLSDILPLGSEMLPIGACLDCVAAETLQALSDAPSANTAMKDGYALRVADIAAASTNAPKRLAVIGTAAAGGSCTTVVQPGTAVRILTGAMVPAGADGVMADELTCSDSRGVSVCSSLPVGANILPKGTDISAETCLCRPGDRLTPARLGLLAAAGHAAIPVFRRPLVGILAIGDELLPPGAPSAAGAVYASNMVMFDAWCRRMGMQTSVRMAGDVEADLLAAMTALADSCDAMLTIGGAWTGDRDLVEAALVKMGWVRRFHRIRLTPGKGVGFGWLRGRPVFVLPGGPAASLSAFLHLALPGLFKLAGHAAGAFPEVTATLASPIPACRAAWSRSILGSCSPAETRLVFHPLRLKSRLRSVAEAGAVLLVPEDAGALCADAAVRVKLLV